MAIDLSGSPDAQWDSFRWTTCSLLLVLTATACAANKPTAQLDRAASWAATTRELAIERSLGTIGRRYTTRLLDAGQKELRKISQSLDSGTLPVEVRGRVPPALARLDTIMTRTAQSVDRGDLVALRASAAAADALGDTLQALRKAAGP